MNLWHHFVEPAIAISVVAAAEFAPSFVRVVHLEAVPAARLATRSKAYVRKREYIETEGRRTLRWRCAGDRAGDCVGYQ